jgi:uncharacterized protein (DUF2141 family)
LTEYRLSLRPQVQSGEIAPITTENDLRNKTGGIFEAKFSSAQGWGERQRRYAFLARPDALNSSKSGDFL